MYRFCLEQNYKEAFVFSTEFMHYVPVIYQNKRGRGKDTNGYHRSNFFKTLFELV